MLALPVTRPVRSLRGPVPVAIALVLGIAIAPALDRAGGPPSARWVAALALGVLAVRRRALALPAVFAAGAAHGAAGAATLDGVDDRRADRIVGEVRGPVVRTAHGHGALLVREDGSPTWVWSETPLSPGERIVVTGFLGTPAGPRGPGLVDPADAVRARGAELEVSAKSIARLADDPSAVAEVWRWAHATQADWAKVIDEAGGDPLGRAALRGIVVGDRRDVPPDLDERWRAAGIYHILSVSGLHLAVVAGLLYALLRRAIAGSPWGGRVRPARWAAPIAFTLAVAYTLITGAQLATLRALIVVGVMLAAAMFDRPARLTDAIAIAAIAILAWRPADLFDPAFQLSFTAALVLAVRAANGIERRGVRGWIARGLATSAWISLATAPITAFHFHQVTVGGVVGNLVLTPLVELVALPVGLAGVVIGWDLPIAFSAELVALVDRGAEQLAMVAPVGRVAIANPLVLAVLVVLSIALAARRIRWVGWIALCVAWSLGRVPPPESSLRVTFVDVGQGDAAILELPDGEVWLVDAGGIPGARDEVGQSKPGRTISRVLAAYGKTAIDVAMISHPHPDHYAGLLAIDVPIRELWIAPEPEGVGRPFAAIVARLAARGTRVVYPPLGLARVRAGVELATLGPRLADSLAADPVRSVNDNSLVVTVTYRGRRILFTGDLELEGEDLLVASGLPRIDVVKVAHHGSPTSSSDAFVAAARPALAVISCGRKNPFGFPNPQVLDRWRAAGAEIARTDTEGTIAVVIDDDGTMTVQRFASPTK